MLIVSFNILQHIIILTIYASTLIMFTVGLNMIYSVLKFSNFAHAEFVTLGMFMGWWSLQILGFLVFNFFSWDDGLYLINNIIVHASFAFIIVGLSAIVIDILVFNRMRINKATRTTLTVGSIGVGLIIRYTLGMIWGEKPQAGANFDNKAHFPLDLFGFEKFQFNLLTDDPIFGNQSIIITNYQIAIILFAFLIVLIIDYMFKKTKFGIALRATSDSMELAQVSGINTKRIVNYTWFIAAGITGFAATFVRAELGDFSSIDGFFYLLPIFAVAILGGVGSFRGGIIAGFIIAFTREAATIILSELQRPGGFGIAEGFEARLDIITFSPTYAEAAGFIILIIVLLFRPQGIYGSIETSRERV